MLVRLVHPEKVLLLMMVMPAGIVMLVRLAQLEKARSPMLVTPSGIVMLVRLAHALKAPLPISVTVFPSIVSGIRSSPEAFPSQSVMVTLSSSVV